MAREPGTYGSLPSRMLGGGGRKIERSVMAVWGLALVAVAVVLCVVNYGEGQPAELLDWKQIEEQTKKLSRMRWSTTPDYIANTNDAVNEGVLGRVSSGPNNMNGDLFALNNGRKGSERAVNHEQIKHGAFQPHTANHHLSAPQHKVQNAESKVQNLKRQAAALRRAEAQVSAKAELYKRQEADLAARERKLVQGAEKEEANLKSLEHDQTCREETLRKAEAKVQIELREAMADDVDSQDVDEAHFISKPPSDSAEAKVQSELQAALADDTDSHDEDAAHFSLKPQTYSTHGAVANPQSSSDSGTGSHNVAAAESAQRLEESTAPVGGLKWDQGMGTDISVINTLDFPAVMKNGVHNNPANTQAPPEAFRSLHQHDHRKLAPSEHHVRPRTTAGPAPKLASAKASSQASLAQSVAKLVLGAIRPELRRQEAEIQHLRRSPVSRNARSVQLSSQHGHGTKKVHSAGLGPKEGGSAAAKQKLSIVDYNMQDYFKHGNPYDSVAPADQKWAVGTRKGSPCSVSGECNHGKYWMPWHDARLEKADYTVGKGKGDEEWRQLGNNVFGRSFDDYVTPNDAMAHDMLTSGDTRVDHFADMPPLSKRNELIMYGTSAEDFSHFRDHEHMRGRGAFNESQFRVGEEQLGARDEEVPVQLSTSPMPGPNPDHFGTWRPGSNLNQIMINGRYWKDLQSAGLLDRWTPLQEMHDKSIGLGVSGHPLADMVVGTYNYISGRGVKRYPDKVFTGTHEIIEDRKGVVGSGSDISSIRV